MNKTGSGGAMSCSRGELSRRPCCQDFCECLCKMADGSEMFGLADACRGLFSRAQLVAEGARRQGEGTAEGTDTTSMGDSCSQDGTRLDHLIAELRTNMIDLISLDVDVLRQFLHVYEEIEDLKLQRQFSIDGYDSASTYSYESGSSMESLQSVGRPLSGGFDSAMTYQSRGSRRTLSNREWLSNGCLRRTPPIRNVQGCRETERQFSV
ncbi:Hypp7139 [Branchiostoma lanceolatum]|uniref:Hypp7139 protein n=1 Tax=Branchiostoma lanceolatum TaxID=7740 RepID=A0A8J9YXV5_BRALA|nr:Hypp7139 [Branchiostoma lanceolatum]